MAGARGSANGSATAGRGARVLERADASAAAAGDDGASADGEPRGRLNGKPRSGGGHSQARVPAPAGARTLGSARTLTIGEAAARLAVEFPGMTVAVLRRLEAAGKFTPGRSSSGYRRYSETDLDLIRIVLADQPIGEEAVLAQSGPAYQADPADMSGAESPLTHPGVYAPGTAQAHALSTATQRPAAARTTARAARVPSSRVPAARPAASSRTQAPAIAALFDVAPGAAPNGRVAGPPPAVEAVTAARPASTRTDSPRAVPAQSASAPTQSPSTRRADRRWPDADFFTPDLGEVSLDRDQLAAAARTDREWIDGLMEYGVLPATDSAGGADLLVAKASAELAQFGVEPRHLRAVAASAARVAELIAAATSSGSGRDSARRERAILAAPNRSAEAAAAAVRLHAALVRAALLRG